MTNGNELTDRRRSPFRGSQLAQIEAIVDERIQATLGPPQQWAELVPFIRSLKSASDERAAFWVWMREQAQYVASTNIRYAINAGLWFILMVVVLGVSGVWRKLWPWA